MHSYLDSLPKQCVINGIRKISNFSSSHINYISCAIKQNSFVPQFHSYLKRRNHLSEKEKLNNAISWTCSYLWALSNSSNPFKITWKSKVLEEKKSTVCEIIIINAYRTEITVVKGATTIAKSRGKQLTFMSLFSGTFEGISILFYCFD